MSYMDDMSGFNYQLGDVFFRVEYDPDTRQMELEEWHVRAFYKKAKTPRVHLTMKNEATFKTGRNNKGWIPTNQIDDIWRTVIRIGKPIHEYYRLQKTKRDAYTFALYRLKKDQRNIEVLINRATKKLK